MVYMKRLSVYLIVWFLDLFKYLPAQVHSDKPVGMREAFNLFSIHPDFQITLLQDTVNQKLIINQFFTTPEKTGVGFLIEVGQTSLVTVLKQAQIVAVPFGLE
jgi:predicted secreted protein